VYLVLQDCFASTQ